MMKNEKDVPHNDYSVDEILAEAKVQKKQKAEPAPEKDGADGIVRSARKALNMDTETADEPAAPPEKKPGRKKKHSFFHHNEEENDSIPEDDIYYGLQLKSLEEYRREYEETINLDTQTVRTAEEEFLRKTASREDATKKHEKTEPQISEPLKEPESVPAPAIIAENENPALKAEEKAEPPISELFKEPQPEETSATKIAEPDSLPAGAAEISQAKPTDGSTLSDDRQDILEKIMRHVGLGAEDVFDSEDKAIPKPEFPVNPPRTPAKPVAPPVLPSVEPGPPLGPEQEPPIQEPPPEPSPMGEETDASQPESPGSSISDDTEEKPETSAITAEEAFAAIWGPTAPPHEKDEAPVSQSQSAENGADNSEVPEAPAVSAEEKVPAAIREPVAPPHEKDEAPAPPAVKEPPQKEAPRYRSASLPLHIVELNAFDDALAAEADGYAPPPIHAPEPIPFPVTPEKENPQAPADGESAPPQKQDRTGNVRTLPLPETKKTKKRFRVFGSEEDPAPPDGPPEEPEEELEDYSDPGDAPSVLNDLLSNVHRLFIRLAAMCLFTILATGFAVTWEHLALLPAGLHNLYTAQNCLIVQLILLIASAAFCIPTILSGLRGLFRLQANSDSAVAVAVIAAAAQNAIFLSTGFPSGFRLYSSLAVFALLLDTVGKFSMSKRILRNFRFLTSSDEKYAVQMFDDYNTAIQMTKALASGGPKIAYQTKAGFLSHFLKHSYASDPGEHVSQFLAPAGFLGSLALCIVAAVLTKNPATALTAFTASACLCVPFGGPLSVNLPLARLNRIAARSGGMAVGWDAVERFSDTDAAMLDAQDLFPRGTVVLNGIQTFAGQRIDEAILDATALTEAVGGTLSDLFSQIVKTRGEVLPHVERPVYEEGLGISGTVSDRVILVGTGELLKRHGVDAPSHDYEEKYLRSGKIPVYLASGGLLVAMFLVFYRSDRRRAAELRRLESNGISLLVRTRDPNITPELIADCFGLSPHSVAVLPERLGSVYASLQAHPPERVSAILATKGRAIAMMRLLTACSRQRSNISIGVALQTAGAALGFALAAFFTACSGLRQLSATVLLLFEAFWAVAVILVPKIRKP